MHCEELVLDSKFCSSPRNGHIISQPCSSLALVFVLCGKDSQKMMSNSFSSWYLKVISWSCFRSHWRILIKLWFSIYSDNEELEEVEKELVSPVVGFFLTQQTEVLYLSHTQEMKNHRTATPVLHSPQAFLLNFLWLIVWLNLSFVMR